MQNWFQNNTIFMFLRDNNALISMTCGMVCVGEIFGQRRFPDLHSRVLKSKTFIPEITTSPSKGALKPHWHLQIQSHSASHFLGCVGTWSLFVFVQNLTVFLCLKRELSDSRYNCLSFPLKGISPRSSIKKWTFCSFGHYHENLKINKICTVQRFKAAARYVF